MPVKALLTTLGRTVPEWLSRNEVYRREPEAFFTTLAAGRDKPAYLASYTNEYSMWWLKVFTQAALQDTYDRDALAALGRSQEAHFSQRLAIVLQHPARRLSFAHFDAAMLLSTLAVCGWKDACTAMAVAMPLRFESFLLGGDPHRRSAWFATDLFASWLEHPVPEARNRPGDLAAYEAVLATWHAEDPEPFSQALDAAAAYRAERTGHPSGVKDADDVWEISREGYWVFPAELLAAMRLREWRGLEPARPSHALFTATPVGALPEPVARPDWPDYLAAEQVFRKTFPLGPMPSSA